MKTFFWTTLILILSFGAPTFAKKHHRRTRHEKPEPDPYQFKNKKLQIDGITLNVEIAENQIQLERGLMYRTALKENSGMLFVFPDEAERTFWMKNTFIGLRVGFFDKDKKLVDVQEMRAVKSEMDQNPPTYKSAKPVMYALEVPRGWFEKNKIKMGDSFTLK